MKTYPKYIPLSPIEIENRIWPTRRLRHAPVMAAVDLRDGNQAFARPMNAETKLEYFRMLTAIGFREIEAAYPAASREEFDFVRALIEHDAVPAGVSIGVLMPAIPWAIDRTMEAVRGAKSVILHCYVATSDLHTRFVLGKSREEILEMAVEATRRIAARVEAAGMRDVVRYEFSPEEFSDSDVDFIAELASGVREAWGGDEKEKFILNLPATVERRPPYEFADMVELFTRKYPYVAQTTLSVHTHNDQGCAVAAAEMAVLAGADRVEGTLCGHGERTGNMDLMTFALNLHSRGIATGLDFSHLPEISHRVEAVSGIGIHPRHPYAGELVFTAFSGTHQDAIRKGLARRAETREFFRQEWRVPYLHIDPADLGRGYEGLIRINSQSGKGGVAYVLESVYGISLPKTMHGAVAQAVQREAESTGAEVTPETIYRIFTEQFVHPAGPLTAAEIQIRRPSPEDPAKTMVTLTVTIDGVRHRCRGSGSGPIEGAVAALGTVASIGKFQIESYVEHALGEGADARAIAFIGIRRGTRETIFGVGIDQNVNLAAIAAIVAAWNRASRAES